MRSWRSMVVVLCLGAGGCNVVAPSPPAPVEGEFFGVWCSTAGDVLTLRADHFTITALSAALDGQIVRYDPPFDPEKTYRWDEPPPT